MIVWSGFDGQITFFNTGGRYSPSTDTWVATNITSAPSERGFHTAVWTGSEMIVWGVSIAVATWIPAGDIIPASTAGSPPAPATSQLRELDTRQLLSDSEMIVWGGASGAVYWNTGREIQSQHR